MQTKTYHSQIGFPSNFRRPVGSFRLSLTRHATQRCADWNVEAPTHVNFRYAQIFEIDMVGDKVSKIVCRVPYDGQYDLCMAIGMRGGPTVITLWLNDLNDKHNTLNLSRYDRP